MASGVAVTSTTPEDSDRPAEEILAAAAFRVEMTREHDTIRIAPVGEIDLATIGELRRHTTEAMTAGPGRLILDLREVTFLDSSALHLAVEVLERSKVTGTRFAIVPGPPVVQRTFEVAGLIDRLPFVDVPRA